MKRRVNDVFSHVVPLYSLGVQRYTKMDNVKLKRGKIFLDWSSTRNVQSASSFTLSLTFRLILAAHCLIIFVHLSTDTLKAWGQWLPPRPSATLWWGRTQHQWVNLCLLMRARSRHTRTAGITQRLSLFTFDIPYVSLALPVLRRHCPDCAPRSPPRPYLSHGHKQQLSALRDWFLRVFHQRAYWSHTAFGHIWYYTMSCNHLYSLLQVHTCQILWSCSLVPTILDKGLPVIRLGISELKYLSLRLRSRTYLNVAYHSRAVVRVRASVTASELEHPRTSTTSVLTRLDPSTSSIVKMPWGNHSASIMSTSKTTLGALVFIAATFVGALPVRKRTKYVHPISLWQRSWIVPRLFTSYRFLELQRHAFDERKLHTLGAESYLNLLGKFWASTDYQT